MNILSIDTTTKIAAVTLKKDDKIISEAKENEITHSEKLLPLIDDILKKENLDITDISMYMVLNGPGSFTGVRIGLATIKAFAFVTNTKIFSISSLKAMAISSYLKNINDKNNETKYILSLIDARNDRAYYSLNKVYIKDDKIICENIIPEDNDILENISSILKNHIIQNSNTIENISIVSNFKGDTLNSLKEIFNFEDINIPLELQSLYPTTEDLLSIYDHLYNVNEYIFDTYTLDANYVRVSQAERIKNEKNN